MTIHETVLGYLQKQTKPVSQHDIAEDCIVGSHFHEKNTRKQNYASTLRQVRQIVRDLRIDFGQPILSGKKGYWIAEDSAEVVQYCSMLEQKAKSSAAAYFETFKAMKQHLPRRNTFFNFS